MKNRYWFVVLIPVTLLYLIFRLLLISKITFTLSRYLGGHMSKMTYILSHYIHICIIQSSTITLLKIEAYLIYISTCSSKKSVTIITIKIINIIISKRSGVIILQLYSRVLTGIDLRIKTFYQRYYIRYFNCKILINYFLSLLHR